MGKTEFIDLTERIDMENLSEQEKFYLSIEAERVFEDLGVGNDFPRFANGEKAFIMQLRDPVGKKLYEHLKERYEDNDD